MTNYLIEAKDVTVSYPDDEGGTTVILDDVSLKIREGELVTVVGPSGCGKSTMLGMVLGSQHPTTGAVFVQGKKVERVTRDCGIVYQNYSLLPHLSVLDNIALGPMLEQLTLPEYYLALPAIGAEHIVKTIRDPIARSRRARHHTDPSATEHSNGDTKSVDYRRSFKPGPIMGALEILKYFKTKREARELAYELLFDIGLSDKDADKYPYELSGGMRQRVSIAQALIMKPKILLMDEPFGALDHLRREEMQDFIHTQWQKYHLTVLFVTHDLDEAVKVGTRLVCLSQYWTQENGAPSKGARIVVDAKVFGGTEKPSTFAKRPEFQELVDMIGNAGLNPHNCRPPSKFDLTHEDATRPGDAGGATA